MLIVITGSPGAGKTSSAELLGKLIDAEVLHLKEFVQLKKLAEGRDRKMKSDIVDLKKLGRELKKEIKKEREDLIVEGHLACEIPLGADYAFVLRCEPKELEKRLRKRKYNEVKIRENLLSEMLDYCLIRSESNFRKDRIFQLETNGKSARETAGKMLKIISGKGKDAKLRERINYTSELKEYLGLDGLGKWKTKGKG